MIPHLGALEPGSRVEGLMLVFEIEPRTLGDRAATIVTLGNGSGRLPSAPFWNGARRAVAGLAGGDVVQVRGRIGVYRGRRQLEIDRIQKVARGLVDLRALLPSIADVGPYWRALDHWRSEMRRVGLAKTLGLFYDDPAFRGRFGACPGSPAGHHAMLGGLLRHTYEVAVIGRAIGAICGADPEIVLAGALLHDIGKVEAYRWDGRFEVTDAGVLLGHVVLGARLIDRRIRAAPVSPCAAEELDLLLHLVLAHHGKLEFGAAVQPVTLEAEILHFADDASAKSASMALALSDPANFMHAARVSARIWQLDGRRVYRGSCAFAGDARRSGPERGTAA